MADEELNFNRQYRLIAGQGDRTGFSIGETSAENPVPLHIAFSIQKSDLETQNTGKIEIWNLNKNHIAELEKSNCIVALKAGYGARMSLIFSGFTSFVSTVADGADRKTTIEVLDSLTAARDAYVSLSYNGTVSWKTIFNDVAAKMGVTVVYAYNVQFTNVSNGYSYVGLAKNVLTKGCECCGLSWNIQNGVLHIKRRGDAMSRQGYVISADTGMIGTPERVVISDANDTSTSRIGYDVKFFLNGAVNIDDYVRLESGTVTGYFYVYSLEITGDNIKGDWLCKARLLELSGNAKPLKTIEEPETPAPADRTEDLSIKVNDIVQFTGGPHYASSNMDSYSSTPKAGPARVTAISDGAKHPYHLIHTDSSSTVYGWVDASYIQKNGATTKSPAPAATNSGDKATFSKGDKVRVSSGAKTYTGGGLASFVYTTVYTVLEVKGDRVVIGLNGVVTAAVNSKDLYSA